jgi:hypothetical protein
LLQKWVFSTVAERCAIHRDVPQLLLCAAFG